MLIQTNAQTHTGANMGRKVWLWRADRGDGFQWVTALLISWALHPAGASWLMSPEFFQWFKGTLGKRIICRMPNQRDRTSILAEKYIALWWKHSGSENVVVAFWWLVVLCWWHSWGRIRIYSCCFLINTLPPSLPPSPLAPHSACTLLACLHLAPAVVPCTLVVPTLPRSSSSLEL